MILFRKLHKWIALAIGIQVAIWMLSGLVMGLLDHDLVTGHNTQAEARYQPVVTPSTDFVDVNTITSQLASQLGEEAKILRVRLHTLLGRATYSIVTEREKFLYDATSGLKVPVDDALAQAIAVRDYGGEGSVGAITKLEAPTMEVRRHTGIVWRVDFDDAFETSVYVSGQDGSVLERRNSTWRLFDLFWMLHIMDYQNRESFNNAFAIIFSLTAAWFAITGMFLLFDSFNRNEFLALLPGDRWRKKASVTILAPHGELIARVDVASGSRLYDELAKEDIVLPSSCGGGGTCGLCVVELDPNAPETAADRNLIPEHKRRAGVRLSCQAQVTDGMEVAIPGDVLAAETFKCTVEKARVLTPHIREITLSTGDHELAYTAGSFVHVVIPPHKIKFDDAPTRDAIRKIWSDMAPDAFSLCEEEIRRAYSLATAGKDNPGKIVLNVRFMPPPDAEISAAGTGSGFMWNLSEGDEIDVVGPLGDFHSADGQGDMIIVGGGAGMAPLRAIVRDELLHKNSGRQIRFWYGARTRRDLLYVRELDDLQARYDNFSWHPALSGEEKGDQWSGLTGFVHLAVKENVLDSSTNGKDHEYFVCGPPAMLAATRQMLADYGVPSEQVFFDDFGI